MNDTVVSYQKSIVEAIERLTQNLETGFEQVSEVGESQAYRRLLSTTVIPAQHCQQVLRSVRDCINRLQAIEDDGSAAVVARNLALGCDAVERQYEAYRWEESPQRRTG
ncbi:hypothetical protein H0X32_03120 [Patescibacteria group bacterium]|nr:hypothetical protein [Patescibacteria group bacterium]